MLYRPRRLRLNNNIRSLVRENNLTIDDLIYPIFVSQELAADEIYHIEAMPGIKRFGLKQLIKEVKSCVELGIKAIALFPVVKQNNKSLDAKEAFNPYGIMQKAIQEIKKNYPQLLIISDVALDPYTTHGQDGIIDDKGYVLNDETTEVLIKQALSHAKAGADIIAPSDMMDGRVGRIRQALEENGYINTIILSYAAKYSSCYYQPFRDAVGSNTNLNNADKNTYQMDYANSNEAIKEVRLDLTEGADIVMVKPGIHYLDIIYRVKQEFEAPVFAYHVSGEYSMLKLAAQNNIIDEKKAVLETMVSFKRAGADAILSYYAKDIAAWLN